MALRSAAIAEDDHGSLHDVVARRQKRSILAFMWQPCRISARENGWDNLMETPMRLGGLI
jgi:hypothetical protein